MRVFVTGASGFVGSAVVEALIAGGHQVLGLVRSEAAAAAVAQAGAEVLRGTLEDLEGLRHGAASADAVVHTAFNHDFSKFAQNCELDRRAIDALGGALKGSGRRLIVTSGLGNLAAGGGLATESARVRSDANAYPRVSEATCLQWLDKGVHAMVMRLPPSVHGRGDHGFVPILVGIARDKGVSGCVGEGTNRWPAVHRRDAAQAYRLALEQGGAGACFHAVAEEGIPLREIAGAIGQGLALPVVGIPAQEVGAHFGWFAMFAGMDVPASSAQTRAQLGWVPREAGLLADMAASGYFGT